MVCFHKSYFPINNRLICYLGFHFDFFCAMEHTMDLIVTSFDISLHCKINDFCLNQNRVSHVQFYYLYNVSPIHDCIFISVKWYGWSSTVNHRTKHVFYTYKNISSHCSNSFHKTMTFVNVKTSVRIYVHAPSQVIISWFCLLCIDF